MSVATEVKPCCPACGQKLFQAVEWNDAEKQSHRLVICSNEDCVEVCRDGGIGTTFEAAAADLARHFQLWKSKEQTA